MAVHTKVLVVANVTAARMTSWTRSRPAPSSGPVALTLLMPAEQIGAAGREAAKERLDAALAKWREAGLEAAGVLGDADPVEAVQENWDPRSFDEVIVSTLPGQTSNWIRFDLPHRIARITDAQVTHVVARDHVVHGEPLPPREKSSPAARCRCSHGAAAASDGTPAPPPGTPRSARSSAPPVEVELGRVVGVQPRRDDPRLADVVGAQVAGRARAVAVAQRLARAAQHVVRIA